MTLVCVNPMLVGRAREAEDYTRDKSDDKDAMLIARLVAQLHCYAPECADETWARLRQLGARRERLVTEATACVQQLRDLLECVWPGVLEAAAKPFDSSQLVCRAGGGVGALQRPARSGWPGWAWRDLRPRWFANCRVGVGSGDADAIIAAVYSRPGRPETG